jgi:cytochrome c-type biogenesis protein CcmF
VGALIMALGGIIAAADRRYRKLAQRDAKQGARDGVAPPVREQHA